MKNMSQKVIFFGTEDFSLTALRGLVEAGYDIAAVITKPDSKRGRKQALTPPSVKVYAASQYIPVWQPTKLSDVTEDIKSTGSLVGVLVSYGKIIPDSIINLFKPGIINVHPSLLPLYRGPSPIESAIISGDSQTGVSIMQLATQMDAGPIYAQITYPLSGHESKPELYAQLAAAGTELLLDTLPDIINESLRPTAQADNLATYCQLLSKEDSLLRSDQLTAEQAERKVRAHLGFPKTKTTILDHEIIITKAHVTDEPKTPLDVLCRGGAYLSIDELIAPSGRLMSAQAFLNGYAAG